MLGGMGLSMTGRRLSRRFVVGATAAALALTMPTGVVAPAGAKPEEENAEKTCEKHGYASKQCEKKLAKACEKNPEGCGPI